jgi:tRNA pseudouridine65 synthase
VEKEKYRILSKKRFRRNLFILPNVKILYQDEYIIAINKTKWIVGPQIILRDAKVYAIQELRNQGGQHVYPVHRLDRKTSGVLLFALDKSFKIMNDRFATREVEKYLAILRGTRRTND